MRTLPLASCRRYSISCPVRTVFSKSGTWEPHLTIDIKKEVEEFWKPIVQRAPRRPGRLGKYYTMSMFPYPSGSLHMGHVRVYAISDAMARYRRLLGYEVIHPMGWDAFGLPAENAALDQNMPAHLWTESNIGHMKNQLLNMGFDFDWDREVRTCDPSYYRWTQYLFLKLFEAGLVYRREAFVNFDPVDQTVLANEQVDEKGCSWRSGAKIERKLLKQWFIRTSRYAKELRDGLDAQENWRDVVAIQKHWIGNINGNWVKFDVVDKTGKKSSDTLRVFTENAYGIFGAAYVALKPTHELCGKYTIEKGQLNASCYDPLTGNILPIFVLHIAEHFGLDCETHLGIPSILEKDKKFADSHKLTYREILDQKDPATTVLQNSDRFSNLPVEEAKLQIVKEGISKGVISEQASVKMNDWLISRQRYWGTPIPIVHCEACGPVPVPLDELPVKLPLLDKVSVKGGSILASQTDWLNTKCPRCRSPAKRETDTMDTFVDSSWYYLRYLDPHNEKVPFDKDIALANMPVDLYIGGKEHALMHFFYARFIGYFLYDLGLLPQPEPFTNLLAQGFVQGKSYRQKNGRYLKPEEINTSGKVPVEKATGNEVIEEWEKMSKSKYNGLDPDEAVAEYGVDATRLFMLGNVSPRSHRRWDPEVFKGILNWQHLLWATVGEFLKRNCSGQTVSLPEEQLKQNEEFLFNTRNSHLLGVNNAMTHSFSLNLVVTKLMSLSGSLRKVPAEMITASQEYQRTLQQCIIMLFPFAPHFSAELWSGLRSVPKCADIASKDVWEMDWPQLDLAYPLNLNIKLSKEDIAVIKVPRVVFDSLTKEQALTMALADAEVQKHVSTLDAAAVKRADFNYVPESHASLHLYVPEALWKLQKQAKAEKVQKKAARAKSGSAA